MKLTIQKEQDNLLNELITIADWLRWAMSQFEQAQLYYGHGTDNAWDEALALILSALHLPHDMNAALLNTRLTLTERKMILNLLQRRITERVPAAYLTQQAWFAGKMYHVDPRVLIPRSPLAELIENHFAPWVAEPNKVTRILDLGTGSGCIAIACALAFPDAQVDAVDVSADALEVAKINATRHQVTERVRLIKGELFQNVHGEMYDIIISNPPYVSRTEMQTLPPEYLHEPKIALEADAEGLDIVLKILHEAEKYLSPHGSLIVEVGNSEHLLQEKFPEIPFYWLEFARGGNGVFLLTAEQLSQYQKLK